jgi:hypothetical protein
VVRKNIAGSAAANAVSIGDEVEKDATATAAGVIAAHTFSAV